MECGFRRLVFEGENETIIRRIQNDKLVDRSYLGETIKGIQKIQSGFDMCSFKFIHRDSNIVAHMLAQLALIDPNKVWLEEVPPPITDVYFHDLLN